MEQIVYAYTINRMAICADFMVCLYSPLIPKFTALEKGLPCYAHEGVTLSDIDLINISLKTYFESVLI